LHLLWTEIAPPVSLDVVELKNEFIM
jgi:hypothetical protein